MFGRWLNEVPGGALHDCGEPMILKRRIGGSALASADSFDPVSEDVLRRYRSYAAELAITS